MDFNIKQKVEELRDEGYNFRFGDYVGEGFNIYSKYIGGFIGFSLLYLIIATFISGLQEASVILGGIANLLVMAPLSVGYFIVASKIQNGERPAFEHFFDGFKDWQELVILSLLMGLMYIAAILPFGMFTGYFIYFGAGFETLLEGGLNIDSGLFMIATFSSFFLLIAISVSFAYASMFIVFHKVTAIEALGLSFKVISKKWLVFWLFYIVLGIISILGTLGLVIGLLVTIPAMVCSNYLSFHDVVGVENLRDGNLEDHFVEM